MSNSEVAGGAAGEPVMLPASFAQELMWLLERASPGTTAYNVPRLRRLVGKLDVPALRRAFDALVERHEVLRTTFATVEDQAVQVIHAARPVPFEVVDLRATPAERREAEAMGIVKARTARPFDLAQDLLMRVTLVQMTDDEHLLLFESHHVAFDGWSRDIVFRELGAFYEAFTAGTTADLPALTIQVADFAIWQREQLTGDALDALIGWWRTELSGAEFELRLPTDFPRPVTMGTDGVTEKLTIAPATRDAIAAMAKQHDATLYMVLLAAYTTVLHRWTGQDDILVGSPIAGRAQAETHGLIGYFANTIVQRGRFAGGPTFGEVLRKIRESALGAYDHQDVPFEKLVLELQAAATAGQSPIFQVVFTQLDQSDAPEARIGDVRLLGVAQDGETTKFDLTFFMGDRPDGLQLMLRARRELHRRETVARLLKQIESVLLAAVADPTVRVDDIDLRTPEEREALAGWQGVTVDEGPAATVVALFERQVDRVGGRLAVVGPRASATAAGSAAGTQPLTYAELELRANQLAHRLRALGVKPGMRVGLLLDRSADAIVGLMGILKSGGAYVPLATEAPASRLAQQVNDADAMIVVSHAAAHDKLPSNVTLVALDAEAAALGALPTTRPAPVNGPDDLAYVLFTSGSTGVPKGVAVTHANIVHYTRAVSRVFADVSPTTAGDGLAALDGLQFGMVSTIAADLGNTCLFPALLAGGSLHTLSKDVTTEPARFAEYVAVHQLDILKITPNHLLALAAGRTGRELADLLPRKWLVTGGEALKPLVARTLLGANKCRVLNHYGPTETTVGVCTFEVTAASLGDAEGYGAQIVPLGRPLANTHAFVVDAHGHEQPLGIPGELLIGGAGVTQGYLKRAELTAEKYAMHAGERVYRTGDRVRRLPDGTIEFLGRADDQVKLRGYRIELGEIEQVLAANPGVAQAVAVVRTDEAGDQQLIAYAVAKQAGYAVSHADRPTREKLMDWMTAQLPAFMVPATVVLIDALPLTANGKVDKAKLPAADAALTAVDRYVAPRTDTETKLAAIWADVLKKEKVGITDSFLDLGGHSLMAIRVLGKISKTFGVRLPLRAIFETPTVEALAEHLDMERKLAALENMTDAEAEAMLKNGPGAGNPS
jgi:amino acid adenylation domain-containing protein